MALLALTLVLSSFAAILVTGAVKPLPSVYINMDLSLTWSQFCLLDIYFRSKVAELLIGKDGHFISAADVHLHNRDDNCPAKDKTTKVSLTFYVLNSDGASSGEVDVVLTKRAYKILNYLIENNIDRLFSDIFQGQIEKLEIAGEEAPKPSNDLTELERTYIALGIGSGVIALIILVLSTVYFIKKWLNPSRGSQYKPGYTVENSGVIELEENPPSPAPQQKHVYEEDPVETPSQAYDNPQVYEHENTSL